MQEFPEWPAPAKALAALLAALLFAAIRSVLASAIFRIETGIIHGHHGVPFQEFWLYLWFYGFGHPVVGVWLKLSAGIATALPVLLLAARIMRKGFGGSVRELHGRTRWANLRELRKEFRAKFAGLYIGYTAHLLRREYLCFAGAEHLACYAPTRSGKGVSLVIPNCLLFDGSLVVLDIKKENYARSAGARKQAGQKVFLFDPLDPEGRTARYNPLSYVRRDTLDAFEDIQRTAQMVFPNVQGEQAFWQDSARSALIGATAFLAETPELPLTIGEVLRLLTRHDGPKYMIEQVTARRIAQRPYTEATVSALTDYLKGSADLVNNIRKTITAKLSLWFNPRIDAATSASDFDLRTLRHSLHAIYVGVTPDNVERLQPLLALFFQQLVDLTVRTLPQLDPKAKHPVLLLLDEFPVLGPMPVLASAFAFVAGYGMRLMLIMQSKAQLRDPALYGPDKAAAILDNCGVEVVFGTKDLALMKELSERLGYDTVEAHSHSGPRFWRMFRGARLNETASDQRRALLLPKEISRLRSYEMIVIRPGMFPIGARRIRNHDERTFSRLVFPPPEVPAIDIPARMDRGTVPLPTPAEGAAPDAATPKSEALRTKKAKPAAEAAASVAPASSPPAPTPAMPPFQSEERWCTEAVTRLRFCRYDRGMPFKFNASRRHRIPKARYRVRNWPAYEAGLRRRGDLTLWMDEAALDKWQAPRWDTPGGRATYSDLAIEMVLMLRTVFHLALRQAEAFAGSMPRLLGLDLRIPDHTTLSRRSSEFATRRPSVVARARHLILDSTGLKLFGQGAWNEERYGRSHRMWRKLHLAIDANTGEVVANALTENDADDIGEVPGLLEQVDGEITSFIADGTYDADPVYQAVARQQHDPPPDVVIPPRASAVLSTDRTDRQSQRDRHIRMMAEKGRMGWQKATGYGKRSLVERAIGRYKHSIGSTLRARSLVAHKGEVAIAVRALNRMIRVGKPISVRVT